MKLFLEAGGVTVEIEDRSVRYQPDVLDDWATRATAMVHAQRLLDADAAAEVNE